jgi:putative lipoprotein
MNKSHMLSMVVLGAVLLAACGPIGPAATKPAGPSLDAPFVTGTVTYLVRSALPPTAVIEVVLQDVSKMDVPAVTISSQRIEAQDKQVPFPYALQYDPAQIDEKNTYAVRATIKDGDQLLFTSTQSYPVITKGAPTRGVEIVVEPVASSAPAAESAVTGTVTYLVRSALPPTAVIEVVLQDVSKMDVPAVTISSQRIEANGQQVPFPYILKYDPAQIDEKNTYAVCATIKDGDQLLFTSTTAYPVITRGNPTSGVEIIVEPVASSGPASQSVITGTVTYRNRSALPPTAVIEVSLQDISLADAPAKVISTQQIEAGGNQPPFAYELTYDPAQIDPRYTYSVSARITDGGELLFISDTTYPVLTRGAPLTDVNILVMAMSQ